MLTFFFRFKTYFIHPCSTFYFSFKFLETFSCFWFYYQPSGTRNKPYANLAWCNWFLLHAGQLAALDAFLFISDRFPNLRTQIAAFASRRSIVNISRCLAFHPQAFLQLHVVYRSHINFSAWLIGARISARIIREMREVFMGKMRERRTADLSSQQRGNILSGSTFSVPDGLSPPLNKARETRQVINRVITDVGRYHTSHRVWNCPIIISLFVPRVGNSLSFLSLSRELSQSNARPRRVHLSTRSAEKKRRYYRA